MLEKFSTPPRAGRLAAHRQGELSSVHFRSEKDPGEDALEMRERQGYVRNGKSWELTGNSGKTRE